MEFTLNDRVATYFPAAPAAVAKKYFAEMGSRVRAFLPQAALLVVLGVTQPLVGQRAEPDVRTGDGSTALHWAVHNEDLEAVNAALRSGAQVSAANALGVTPASMPPGGRSAPGHAPRARDHALGLARSVPFLVLRQRHRRQRAVSDEKQATPDHRLGITCS
jgi:ankyrin repeat protein